MKYCQFCKKQLNNPRRKNCSSKCRNAIYYIRHRKEVLTRNKEWNRNNPDKMSEACLRWKKRNPKKNTANTLNYRNRSRGAEGNHTLEEWEELKMKCDYICQMCGKREPEIKLTEDHIIPLKKNGNNYIDNIQPLCRSCNSIKGIKLI